MPIALFQSPIGTLRLSAVDRNLVIIQLPVWGVEDNHADIENVEPDHQNGLKEAFDYLEDYFAGEKNSWQGRLTPHGSTFYNKVWLEAAALPFGSTISYGALGQKAGVLNAARAVGTAMARNPLPILVPCHRVITSDRRIGGYGGGLEMKRWLLGHEGIAIP